MKTVIVCGLQSSPQGPAECQTLVDTRRDKEEEHGPSRGTLDAAENTRLPRAVCWSEGIRSRSSDIRSQHPELGSRPRCPLGPGAQPSASLEALRTGAQGEGGPCTFLPVSRSCHSPGA